MTDITFPEFTGSEKTKVGKKLNFAYKKMQSEGYPKDDLKMVLNYIMGDVLDEEAAVELIGQFFNIVD